MAAPHGHVDSAIAGELSINRSKNRTTNVYLIWVLGVLTRGFSLREPLRPAAVTMNGPRPLERR